MATDNTDVEELEPCPFCGRKAMVEEFRDDDDPQPLFVATCEVCPVKTYDQFSAQEAARVWNSRASVDGEQTGQSLAESILEVFGNPGISPRTWDRLKAVCGCSAPTVSNGLIGTRIIPVESKSNATRERPRDEPARETIRGIKVI